jgi:F-type H+-transporting ATPase subunit b
VNINLTLFGQMITFMVLVVVTMKYIWPPLLNALENRRKQVAEGLEAAERGHRELEITQEKVKKELLKAKQAAAHIVDQANQRAARIVEEGKERGREEGNRLVTIAQGQIEQDMQAAKQKLLKEVTKLVISGAEKILEQKIDSSTNNRLVDQYIAET